MEIVRNSNCDWQKVFGIGFRPPAKKQLVQTNRSDPVHSKQCQSYGDRVFRDGDMKGSAISDEDVLSLALKWRAQGHLCAVATVLQTFGSAPRASGSHLAVRDDGMFAGSVSAGCVENTVIESCLATIQDGELRRQSLETARDSVWAMGLPCGGTMDVLVEPLGESFAQTVARISETRRRGECLVRITDLATGVDRISEIRDVRSQFGAIIDDIAQSCQAGLVSGRASDVFVRVYNRRRDVVIVGAVHIAQALSVIAQSVGFRVRVIDPRASYAAEERFAGVRMEQCWPHEAFASEALSANCALVALSHDSKIDDEALMHGLNASCFFLGALGSRASHQRRLVRLRDARFSDGTFARVRGPVGLAIGAKGPGEIAIAILGQIISANNQALGDAVLKAPMRAVMA